MESHQHEQLRMIQITGLWTRAQPVVAAMVAGQVVDFHDAEDLVAQTAEMVVAKFASYDPDRPFLPWALGIARNLVLRHLERRAGEQRAVFDEQTFDVILSAHQEVAEETQERLAALRRCMEHVRGKSRKVMEMRYLHDLKPEGISEALNMNRNAVWVMLHRTRSILKKCVDGKLAGKVLRQN